MNRFPKHVKFPGLLYVQNFPLSNEHPCPDPPRNPECSQGTLVKFLIEMNIYEATYLLGHVTSLHITSQKLD